MTRRLLAASLICCVPAALLGGARMVHARQATLALPDTQKLVLENTFVRVFEIRVPPGGFEAKHSHGRGLTIALSDYDNETKSFPDGRVNRGHTAFGEVRWAEPVTHEARNVGTTEQRVIRIELK
jgi:hypothetical protein